MVVGGCGEGLSSLEGAGQREFDLLQWAHGQHKFSLVIFSLFCVGGGEKGLKSWRVDLGEIGSQCDQGELYEMPKYLTKALCLGGGGNKKKILFGYKQ